MVFEVAGSLDRRAVRLPMTEVGRAGRRQLYAIAELLEAGEDDRAEPVVDALVAAAGGPCDPQTLRAAAIARTLLDLHRGGWTVTVDAGHLFVTAPKLADVRSDQELLEAKRAVRGSMGARVRDVISAPTTARLISEVEPAILRVIGKPEHLAGALTSRGADAVKPYLQTARASDGVDGHSGLALYSIFRYLRLLWSFPVRDTPGRTLPILIRDAGQEGHPVCGLLCFASPVLRLTSRDDALGLTPAWLEATVAGLDIDPSDRRRGLDALAAALRGQGRPGLSPRRVLRDVAALVDLDARGTEHDIARRIRRLTPAAWDDGRRGAARRVAMDLLLDLDHALDLISFDGLGITRAEALAEPGSAASFLSDEGDRARRAWEESRTAHAATTRSTESVDLLYRKKRFEQLAILVAAHASLRGLRAAAESGGPRVIEVLRASTSRRAGPFGGVLEGGARVDRGISDALLSRKVGLASTRIADVALCGAIPPYDVLLGGKLAALLSLSADAARLYHGAYDGVASTIQSQMAGEEVRRSADIVALTTASLYGVGSSQYNRLSLPAELGGVAWEEVGETTGHGTLHFSSAAVRLLGRTADEARGRRITGLFGEGPSERMRKLRDGLQLLDLPANELLRHGMARITYVAAFQRTNPGAAQPAGPHRELGPRVEEIAGFWRRRWLGPRLERAAEEVWKHQPESVLLSSRYPAEVDRARAALAEGIDLTACVDEDDLADP